MEIYIQPPMRRISVCIAGDAELAERLVKLKRGRPE
jgi:hypothetical protein